MMDSSEGSELRRVLGYYDLGELVEYERNNRGFVNTAYTICMWAAGHRTRYFLRKYKRGIREEELRFEHSLIEHLVAAGSPVARIHHTRSGETFLRLPDGTDDDTGVFYTVFEYLPGEDRYTWVNPNLTEEELSASANVLGQFHLDAARFTPVGMRMEPKILDLMPVIAETWSTCPARSKGTVFDVRIQEHLETIRSNIAATLATLREAAARSLPQMVVHGDYHPGNLKFTGHSVAGLFDFDWSKVDWRLFDLGLALWYFCTSWQAHEDGTFRVDRAETFLRSYQRMFATHASATPVSLEEAHYLPVMINAGNLYVLHWTVLDYFAKEVDAAEYLVFLDHGLHFAHWYGQPENLRALESMIASVLLPPIQG